MEGCHKQSTLGSDKEQELNLTEDNVETEVEASVNDEVEKVSECHPLQNPVILTHLFGVCSPKELATFRLVSKLWYKLSLPAWRSSATMEFDDDAFRWPDEDFFWQIRRPNTPANRKLRLKDTVILQFLDFVNNPDNDYAQKPYRKFCLVEWKMQDKQNEQIGQFFQLCGPSITTLELNGFQFHDLSGFRDVMYKLCPNLKSLVLKNHRFRWQFDPLTEPQTWKQPAFFTPHKNLTHLELDLDHESLPITWMELFSNYPALKALKVYNMDLEETLLPMLTTMKIMRNRDPRVLQLNDLDLLAASLYAQEKISPEASQLIRQLAFPLKTLTLDVGVATDPAILHDVIQCHAGTLKKLDAYRGPISFPYKNFPFGLHLNNLEEIVFSDRLCESLTFLKFMPNLKKLTICDVVEDRPPIISTEIIKNTDRREMEGVEMISCTKLRLDYVIDAEETQLLTKYFPNIEQLRMPLNNDQFRVVCSHWKNMRKLKVLGNYLGDDGITGLSAEDVKKINEKEESESFAELIESNVPVHANITDLKYLRKFTMLNEGVLPTKLNDCSAYCGFLKSTCLENLKIASQMNSHAAAALKAKIPNCKVFRLRTNVKPTDDDDWDF